VLAEAGRLESEAVQDVITRANRQAILVALEGRLAAAGICHQPADGRVVGAVGLQMK